MYKLISQIAWAIILASAVVACEAATMTESVSTGRIVGKLVLPKGFGPDRFEGAVVALSDGGDKLRRTTGVAFDGQFAFDLLGAGSYGVEATVPGFDPASLTLELEEDEVLDLDEIAIEVSPAATLEGRVRLDGAEDHGGVLIEAIGSAFATLSADDGRFRLSVTAGTWDLRFSAVGRELAVVAGVEAVSGETITLDDDIVLIGAPGSVHGTLQLAPPADDPALLTEASVALYAGDGGEPVETVTVAADGQFKADALDPGGYRLVAQAPGFFTVELTVHVIAAGTTEIGALLLFPDAPSQTVGAVEGRVLLEDAGATAGVHVEALGTPFMTETVASGTFRLTLNPGAYDLLFQHAGYASATLFNVRIEPGTAAGQPLTVDPVVLLPQPGAIVGSVGLVGEVTPWDEVEVTLGGEGSQDANDARTGVDADGRFLFGDVAPGLYRVEVTAPGYQATERWTAVAPGQQVDLGHLDLLPPWPNPDSGGDPTIAPGRITGRVDLGGPAADPAGVRAVVVELRVAVDDPPPGRLTLPVADGRFAFEGVSPGDYTLEVQLDGFFGAALAVTVEAGALTSLDPIVLEPRDPNLAVLIGTAELEGADDHRGIHVEVPGTPWVTETDADGRYRLELPAGTYSLELRYAHFASAVVVAGRVEAGQRIELDSVVLRADPGRVEGTVSLAGIEPPALLDTIVIELRAVDGPHEPPDAPIDVATPAPIDDAGLLGAYGFEPLAVGLYRLDAHADGFQPASRLVEVTPGVTVSVDHITLHPRPSDAPIAGGTGRLIGQIATDGAVADPALLLLGIVELSLQTDNAPPPRITTPTEDGRFELNAVTAGEHIAALSLPGFTPTMRIITVEADAIADLGRVVLVPLRPTEATLVGLALRSGQADHSGIRVEAIDTPIATETLADGAYQLTLPPGEHRLRFSAPRYQTVIVDPGALMEGDHIEMRDVTLAPLPGGVRGTVSVLGGDAAALQAITVSIYGEADLDHAVATQTIAENDRIGHLPLGRYRFDDLPVGDYVVEATLGDTDAVYRGVAVSAGEVVDAPHVELVVP